MHEAGVLPGNFVLLENAVLRLACLPSCLLLTRSLSSVASLQPDPVVPAQPGELHVPVALTGAPALQAAVAQLVPAFQPQAAEQRVADVLCEQSLFGMLAGL